LFFKRLIVATSVAFLFVAAAVAVPVSVPSPTDPLYHWLDIWAARGIIQEEPYLLRPYSPSVLIPLLEEVAASGPKSDADIARDYLAELTHGSFDVGARVEAKGELSSASSSPSGIVAGGAEIALSSEILPTLWAAGHMTVEGTASTGSQDTPRGESSSSEGIYAGGNFTSGISSVLSLEASVFAGGPQLWAQAGMGHASFGPFFDNGVVIGPQAPETPNFTFNARFGGWRYSQGLFLLEKGGTRDGQSVAESIGKDVFFHSFSFSPAAGWDLGIFEAIVVANRFEPMYLLPLADYFLLQRRASYNTSGAISDNSLAGVYASGRVLPGLKAKALVFIDDLDFDQIIRLNLDAKWMLSAQGGLEWAPASGPVRLVAADYTAVMPYMYTHYYTYTSSSDNYQNNWTTEGENFGPALLPNSDRVEVKAYAPLGNGLELTGTGRFIRHGNASAGVTGVRDDLSAHDGSLGDDGWYAGSPTYQYPYETGTSPKYLRFLTQKVLEYSIQAGLGLGWSGKVGPADLALSLRYLFEYRINDGLVEGADRAINYVGMTATILF
jgi:hypothetical protein